MSTTKKHSAGAKKKATNVLVHAFLTILSVIWVFPIFWVVLLSFREQKGQYITSFWPEKFTTANYVKLFTDTALFNFPRWFANTLFVAVCSCILTTFFVLAISYCLSRLRFKIRKPYMNVAMILGMFPGFMAMIAVYYIPRDFLTRSRRRLTRRRLWTARRNGIFFQRSSCPCPSRSSYIRSCRRSWRRGWISFSQR